MPPILNRIMPQSNLVIKISFQGETRKFSPKTLPDNVKTLQDSLFEETKAYCIKVFNLTSTDFNFIYRDKDCDDITCSTFEEFNDSIEWDCITSKKLTCKYTLNTNTRNKIPEKQPEISVPIHSLVTCDACGMFPIKGARFKCSIRKDFDLCSKCEEKSPQQPYPMLKIYNENQSPIKFTVLLRENQFKVSH
jgi:hypothetical protein